VAFPNVKSIRVIPNPVPNDLLSYFLKPSRGRKKLLSIGRLSEEKQVDRIINAFAEIKSGFDDWDLYIYGDGSSRAKIAMQVESLKLTDRAFILGSTTQPWEVMSNADVFVMASQYEGFPNALLEAMAIGLPCVAFDCPSGPREISSDGKNAILVALNDQAGLVAALTQIMDDEELRRSLGGRAKDSVRGKFSLAAVMENWDELFGEVGAIPRRLGVSVLTHGSETLS
jgi:glycosyltransferase involved in cell wall biosynthesis